MKLTHLDIANFRNLVSVKLESIANGFNLFFGNNGSGKTSLLEAIHYLSLGRSFRSNIVERVINRSADRFFIFAHLARKTSDFTPIGIERHQSGEINMRVDGRDIRSIAELAELTPVQLIDSHCHELLESGPSVRRKYLDWGVFHSAPDFLRIWRQFERALKQRNAALREQSSKKELESWTNELAQYAVLLDKLRREYAENLTPHICEMVSQLLDIKNIQISYYPGWDEVQAYEAILSRAFIRDSYLGYTQFGPHKADFKININHIPAKDILSRGQQKLFVCAMIMARGAMLQMQGNKQTIYLIDDLPSELDILSRTRLIDLLSSQSSQIFVTAVHRDDESLYLAKGPLKMFHVEHGFVKEM